MHLHCFYDKETTFLYQVLQQFFQAILYVEFYKLCDEVSLPLPKGAGVNVDKVGEELVNKYGEEKLKDVAKYNFRNTQRILKTLIF